MSCGSAQIRTTVCQLASQYRSATDNRWMSVGYFHRTVRVLSTSTSLCPYDVHVVSMYAIKGFWTLRCLVQLLGVGTRRGLINTYECSEQYLILNKQQKQQQNTTQNA